MQRSYGDKIELGQIFPTRKNLPKQKYDGRGQKFDEQS